MNDLLVYILKSTLCISVLYLAFRTVMRKETFFALNRILLLSVVACSILIPLVDLPLAIRPEIQEKLMPSFPVFENQLPEFPVVADPPTVSGPVNVKAEKPERALPIMQLIVYVYLAGMLISLLVLIHGLVNLLLLFRKAQVQKIEGFSLLIIEKDIPAFSFWKMIFISQADYNEHGTTIQAHEQQHIRLGHFYDLMLLEMAKMTHWFNPIIYWLIRDLKAIHEYQADQHTLTKGIDATKYQLLIIKKGVGPQRLALANSFNHCQIKKRIAMMNKSKTSKARRWKVATFLPLLALLLIFCSRKSDDGLPDNSFHLNNQSLKLDQCFLLLESSSEPFTFEMDLIGGNIDENYTFEDTTKVKQWIWLSLSPKDKCWLTDGDYKFSSLTNDLRPSMSFSGKIRVGPKEMNITGGDIVTKQDSGKITISFNLEVDKENKIKGSYSGAFDEITRIPQPDSSETKSKIVSAIPALSIVFKSDGNYINGEKYSYDDFIKKVKAWNQADPKSKGLLSFRFDPHVEESVERNREITAISKATYMSFFILMNVDQQAIFPGGVEGMFDWIKQNIKYSKEDKSYSTRRDVGVQFEVNEYGKVINPEVVESVNPTLDAEALRVVSQMPVWQPARRKGVPVSTTQRIAVSFRPQ